MILSAAVMLTGCGGEKTFEEFVKDDPEFESQMEELKDSMSVPGAKMALKFEGNEIIYELKFDQTFEKDVAKEVSEQFETYMKTAGSVFENIAQQCEEESEIDGITVQVLYLNGDGSELYSGTFE